MITLKLSEIQQACGGELYGGKDADITNITTDSRKAVKGSLFAAIKGERTDGHNYIEAATRLGAAAVLCEKKPQNTEISYILTGSTLKALQDIAAYMLNKKNIIRVGIGGSVGKTSTKEAVASVLEQKFSVLKTKGNYNNNLGVPLTIFNLEEENEAAVIEMGIDDFNQMDELASIVRPNICVLTNIGDCHLENLGDRNGVLKAKTEMFNYLNEGDSIVLNGDDEHLSTVKCVKGISPVFFGLKPENDFYADGISDLGLNGTVCDIHTPDGVFNVHVPKPGIHMVYNALAATAVGRILNLSFEEIKSGIEEQENVSGRFNIINENGIRIIDDCYNANPMSMKASLEVLDKADTRKVAVLGDMGELGENEEKLHEEVGEKAAALNIDLLITIGSLSKMTAQAAMKNPKLKVVMFDDMEDFKAEAPKLIKKGDTVLVKASHFMKFDLIVNFLRETELDN